MNDRVSISVCDHVADVRLIRGDKMNALDDKMFAAIEQAGKEIRDNADVRVVVLSGDGKGFCAGLDMGNFATMADGAGNRNEDKLAERTHGVANGPQHAAWMWRE
ncbi:enoyl-CoA hydratase-related protein, partial [Congregibacter sp.]|uniref:enoyl-CoA hydratase-related protein n=1 Tax=Congregibacter sp. TaxID=2744308 RepID=UPI00385E487B